MVNYVSQIVEEVIPVIPLTPAVPISPINSNVNETRRESFDETDENMKAQSSDEKVKYR